MVNEFEVSSKECVLKLLHPITGVHMFANSPIFPFPCLSPPQVSTGLTSPAAAAVIMGRAQPLPSSS